jgi:hypothetical protein
MAKLAAPSPMLPSTLHRANAGVEQIRSLSYRTGDGWVHNPDRAPHRLEDSEARRTAMREC